MEGKMRIRSATIDDARLLFDWRDDPVTRRASYDTGELLFDAHVAWLQATLLNPSRKLLVAEEEDVPVGTVRIDRSAGDDVVELSWTVSPHARGRGVAKQMVQLVVGAIGGERTIRAKVKVANRASAKVAQFVGMELVSQADGVLHYVGGAILETGGKEES
jgi:RimJ/RimL family protein N-acetyltransferase